MGETTVCAKRFQELSLVELYDVLRLRAAVFVVEQDCAFEDPDGLDAGAWHLQVREDGRLVGYARWADTGEGVRIGRVATAPFARGRGLGHRVMRECLERIGPRRTVLHAQDHLRRFYEAHGFAAVGDVFPEDGIPHVTMVREPS